MELVPRQQERDLLLGNDVRRTFEDFGNQRLRQTQTQRAERIQTRRTLRGSEQWTAAATNRLSFA